MNATDPTPKVRDALLLALHADDHTLTRCRDGFRCARAGGTVTRRIANTLRNAMLAEFNAVDVPSAITLTERGAALARQIEAAEAPAKAVAA